MVFMGGTPIGSPLVGWVGEEFGARWSLIGGGLMSILGTLFCVALYLRARRRREAPPGPETGVKTESETESETGPGLEPEREPAPGSALPRLVG
jgi:hypothetical protein